MTPREFFIYVEAFNKRKELEDKNLVYQAYLISRWVWQKNINIEKILETKQEKREMTDEQMLAQVKMLNSLFGGTVKSCNS